MINNDQVILTERWRTERTKEAWAEEQLARACADVAGSAGGSVPRHTTLFKAACRMGAYIQEGLIDYAVVHARLTEAAKAAGLDGSRAGEVYRTIRDGCQRGRVDNVAWFPISVITPWERQEREDRRRRLQDRKRADYRDQIRQVLSRNGGQR